MVSFIKMSFIKELKDPNFYSRMRDLWLEFTVLWVNPMFPPEANQIPMCGLCGNGGIIDTTSVVKDSKGNSMGIRAFCICPNGRYKRKTKLGRKYGKTSDVIGKTRVYDNNKIPGISFKG